MTAYCDCCHELAECDIVQDEDEVIYICRVCVPDDLEPSDPEIVNELLRFGEGSVKM